MARPKKTTEPPKTPPPQQERAVKLTPEKTLTALFKSRKNTKKKVDVLVGDYRAELAVAVEKKHLHKKAYGWAAQLYDMSDEQLGEFFDHFDHYIDVSGIRARAENAPRLDLGDQPGAEDGEDDEDEDNTGASNVTTLQRTAAPNIG